MHGWLLRRPGIGPLIMEWQRHGVIKTPAKIYATTMIVPLFAYTLIVVKVGSLTKGVVALIGIAVVSFIWTRPSSPNDD